MARKSRKKLDIIAPASTLEPLFKVGLYARLSVEDLRKKESDSIGTQISMLRQYVGEQKNMIEVGVYQDIDKTGTNFNREGFNRLLDDIRVGKVNCIVVKDLSRFGRNHIETGNYLERVFPFMGVRFIAIGDNYDSNSPSPGEELAIPLKNLVNEFYAKDISKKTRSQYEMKRQRGDFCGTFAPYGYIKKGNTLVVDEEAAAVVKRIFQLVLEGHSDNAITTLLNYDEILPPNKHRYEQGLLKGEKHSKCRYWYKSVVKRITENPAYLGRLEQGKYRTDIMNGGARIPEHDRVVSLNTHPAIIDEEIFEAVQELRRMRKKNYVQRAEKANRPKSGENILKGIVFCGDCNRILSRHKIVRANGNVDYRYLCPTYEDADKFMCTKKRLLESELLPMIHATIEAQMQTLADINCIIDDARKQASYVNKLDMIDDIVEKTQKSLARITRLRSSLYEDFKNGLLSREEYALTKAKYETQHRELSDQIDTLSVQKNKQTDTINLNKWAAAYSAFTSSKELSRELIISAIERIEVSQSDNVSVIFNCRDEQMALLEGIAV